jgi:hypothetical protein
VIIQFGILDHHHERKYRIVFHGQRLWLKHNYLEDKPGQYYLQQDCTYHGLGKTPYLYLQVHITCTFGGTLFLGGEAHLCDFFTILMHIK